MEAKADAWRAATSASLRLISPQCSPTRFRYGWSMRSSVDADVAKWRSWIEDDIKHDVIDMHWRRLIWREVNQMLDDNPAVGQMPSAFWDFYQWNYAAVQAMAVRRQADTGPRTSALGRLIKEMRDRAEVLTRVYFVGLWDDVDTDEIVRGQAHSAFDRMAGEGGDHLDPAIPRRDLESLQRDAGAVRRYLDQHIAHDQAEPTADALTFDQLHAAIDSIGEMFGRYATVLTAAMYLRVEPVMQDDWKAIFRSAWLPS